METRLIATLKEHEARLTVILNHRDLKPQLNSYIQEFLLNKEFNQLMADVKAYEAVTRTLSEIEISAATGVFNGTNVIPFNMEVDDCKSGFNLSIYTGDTYIESWYETEELAMADIAFISEKYGVQFEKE